MIVISGMKLTATLPVLLAISLACTKGADTTEVQQSASSGVNKTQLLQLVNDTRKKGCQCGDTWYPPAAPVAWNDLLEKAAQLHSRDMYANKYFSHIAADGSNAGVRIDAAGYRWKAYGENIAMGFNSEQEVVAGWIKSPGHCKNIMGKQFTEMGVAKAGSYWTQEFGTR